MRTRVGAAKKQVEKKEKVARREKSQAKWIREQEKKIPAYSTGAQIKKFWENHQAIGSEEDWESETDSSLEVERSQVKEVINLKK